MGCRLIFYEEVDELLVLLCNDSLFSCMLILFLLGFGSLAFKHLFVVDAAHLALEVV